MTLEEIAMAVNQIRDMSDDDESAHASEDELYARVLEVVAASNTHLAPLAAAALKTKEIRFSRWYA